MGLRRAENNISNLLCDPDREAAAPELTPPNSLQQAGGLAGWLGPQTRGQGVADYGP